MKFDHHHWLVAENLLGDQTFLIHTAEPRFTAEIFDEEAAPVEGLTVQLSNGQYAGHFEFIDEPPAWGTSDWVEVGQVMGRALNVYDGVIEADLERKQADEYDEED